MSMKKVVVYENDDICHKNKADDDHDGDDDRDTTKEHKAYWAEVIKC